MSHSQAFPLSLFILLSQVEGDLPFSYQGLTIGESSILDHLQKFMNISNLTNYSNMHINPSKIKQTPELKKKKVLTAGLEQFMAYQMISLPLFCLLSEDQDFI